jgi:hypothetical protein
MLQAGTRQGDGHDWPLTTRPSLCIVEAGRALISTQRITLERSGYGKHDSKNDPIISLESARLCTDLHGRHRGGQHTSRIARHADACYPRGNRSPNASAFPAIGQPFPGPGAGFLFFLSWVAYGVNTVLEAAIFTTYGAASAFTVVIVFFGTLACAALVAFLFAPGDTGRVFVNSLRASFGGRSWYQWAWRLPVAAVAFMPIYLFFGRMVVPFTYEYYQQQLAGLTAPGWGQILPVLFGRSVLFLAASLPVLVTWGESRRSLVLSLGFALFVLVGGMGLIGGYWLPLHVRLFHGVEILADSIVYAWVLVVLLVKR